MDGPAEVRCTRRTGVIAYYRVSGGTVCEMCSDARPQEANVERWFAASAWITSARSAEGVREARHSHHDHRCVRTGCPSAKAPEPVAAGGRFAVCLHTRSSCPRL